MACFLNVTPPLLLLLLSLSYAAGQSCPDSDEIQCGGGEDRCIPLRYICDGDTDCDNDDDEDGQLCEAWRNENCDRGRVQCTRGGETNCVGIEEYCTHSDPPCHGDLDQRICQMLHNNVVQPLNEIIVTTVGGWNMNLERSLRLGQEFALLLNRTMGHNNCPSMYTLVGDQCLSLFFIGSVSWGEARAFCHTVGGELINFKNATHYAEVVMHLKEAQLTTDFWVGGSYPNQTLGWSWVDDSPMELGTPYWAVRYKESCQTRNVTYPELGETREANDGECYNYVQAPRHYPLGRCVSIAYEHYYYMSDEDCLSKRSPLCVLIDSDAAQGGQLTFQ